MTDEKQAPQVTQAASADGGKLPVETLERAAEVV